MRIVSAAVTDRGLSKKRPVNEDSYLEMPEQGLFSVADGVGGAQAGDFASQTAMEVLHEAFTNAQPGLDTEELLEAAITRANEAIYQTAQDLPQLDMMATTIVTLHIGGTTATLGHVGDSRIYRFDSQGNLHRETHDHSMVEDEVRAGRMTISQAVNHPSRNVINRALGADATVEVEMKTIMFEPGTTFLLCSDGITRHVEDHEIRDLLQRYTSLVDVCRHFKSICYSRGAEDNLTAVLVRIEDENAPVVNTDDEDDETTIAGIRPPILAVNQPPPMLSNGQPPMQRGSDSFGERAAEFSAMEIVHPDANTAPLDAISLETAELHEPEIVLKPASQTFGLTDSAPGSIEPTLQVKIDNDRIKSKIDAAEPPLNPNSEPQKKRGLFGRIFGSMLLLVVGAAIGAGGYLAWVLLDPLQTNAPTTQNVPPPPLSTGNLTQQEFNEMSMFESTRRTVDSKPKIAQSTFEEPLSAADHYLRGRAYLIIGETSNARKDFNAAAEKLKQSSEGINAETLKTEIALGLAVVSLKEKTPNDLKLLDELIKTQTGGATPNPTNGGNSNTNAPPTSQ